MSENNQYIPSTALDSFAHALYAERLPEIGTREPYLMVGIDINKNKPQYSQATMKVTHFIRGEERNKAFEVKTKLQYIVGALQQLITYARKPYDGKREGVTWEVKAPKIVNGKMSQEKITAGKIVVGRTEKGPFISVVHWNDKYPRIGFHPGLHDPQAVTNPASDDPERVYEFVCANALGWATTVCGLLTTEYPRAQNAAYDVIRRNQGGNGGGSQGGGSYGGGNYGGGNNNYGNKGNNNSYGGAAAETEVVRSEASGDDFNF